MELGSLQFGLELINNCVERVRLGQNEIGHVFDDLEMSINIIRCSNDPGLMRVIELLEHAFTLLEMGESNQTLTYDHPSFGRPKMFIPFHSLEYLLVLNFKLLTIANLFGTSVSTIKRRMAELNLSVSQTYTAIGEDELDAKVLQILINHPNTGYKRMIGFLLDSGIKVCERRIRQSIRRVDPVGVDYRRRQNRAIYRRQYFVQHSMDMWHIDTHHKLIRWGLIVRGGIDGKSRTIVYLDVGSDNTAKSNFESFMGGVTRFGIPNRTRSDKGGENVLVARFMLETRGTGRASHICGRSVHNQRIERLWRDVHYGCISAYRCTFLQLEEMDFVNLDIPIHVALLQQIFIPRIKRSLHEFMQAWNRHPISSEHGQSPLQIMLTSLPPPSTDMSWNPALDDRIDLTPLNDESQFDMFEIESIQLEEFYRALSSEQLDLINTLDPLRNSTSFGADIYIETYRLLQLDRSFL